LEEESHWEINTEARRINNNKTFFPKDFIGRFFSLPPATAEVEVKV
jgi:hypothetical protein